MAFQLSLIYVNQIISLGVVNVAVSPFPKGVYIFDFSSGGNITNYGGTRDYIDTEKLTEFWIRTTTTTTGSVKVVSECLARLH